MRILAIESSCDETGASVLEEKNGEIIVLSNILATSSDMHARTGGIIPENAAREQVKAMIPVIIEALLNSRIGVASGGGPTSSARSLSEAEDEDVGRGRSDDRTPASEKGQDPKRWVLANEILKSDIDAIAVTYGPGLIGSLLIGVETAKTLSYALGKPLIPVNHLLAHLYANFISSDHQSLTTNPFPFIGLIVSGGHTDLLYFESHTKFKWLGGTRDDAAGEAIDKIGRMLDLPYPAGPEMEKRSNDFKLKIGSQKPKIVFKSPLLNSNDYDFSFSGLKAEAMRFIKNKAGDAEGGTPRDRAQAKPSTSSGGTKRQDPLSENESNEICYAVQKAVFDVLIKKTLRAAEEYNCRTVLLGGGVSANKTLKEQFELSIVNSQLSISLFAPQKEFATDNAAMIGAYALKNFKPVPWQEVKSVPDLYFD